MTSVPERIDKPCSEAEPAAESPDDLTGDSRGNSLKPLIAILAVGAVVRLGLLWWFHGEPVYVVDAQHYNAIARNIVEHGEFADAAGRLTSIRPPLYPALVAGVYGLFGVDNYSAVRAVQAMIGLGMVVLVYVIARRAYSPRVANWAAAICCFYPSLLISGNLLLTEVLFGFLICLGCILLQEYLRRGSNWLVAGLGIVLALAALTRSVLWLFPPLLIVYLVIVTGGGWRKRVLAVAVAVVAFGLTILPWSIRNSRLQRTFVTIDVMGGRNFMMGNYEYTPLFRAWDTISMIGGEQSWDRVLAASEPGFARMTQGQRDKAALKYGLQFASEHPVLTAQRSLAKFFNFWQIERSIVAGAARGWWGGLPKPALLILALTIFGSYALAMWTGVFGFLVAPPEDRRLHWFILLLIGFVCMVHTAVFAHSRYHLPLMPLVFIYSASAIANFKSVWRRRSTWQFRLATGVCLVLLGYWVFEALVIDLNRFQSQVIT